MTQTGSVASRDLLARLKQDAVICAEGYLFEFERRGYLQAGAFVPEVVLEHPEVVAELHREFVHAGSDVVEAFTYYGHREKLRLIGREDDLEPLNRAALEIAKEVADETGALLAGNISNTNLFEPDDESRRTVRASGRSTPASTSSSARRSRTMRRRRSPSTRSRRAGCRRWSRSPFIRTRRRVTV
jgi:hypothetical protein